VLFQFSEQSTRNREKNCFFYHLSVLSGGGGGGGFDHWEVGIQAMWGGEKKRMGVVAG
jgi:hypothetical protein